MKKHWLLWLALSLFPLPTLAAQMQPDDPNILYSMREKKVPREKLPACMGTLFSKADCAPSECEMQHPVVGNFTVRHKVFGMRDGTCLYVQTMPCPVGKDCYLECHYSTETLKLKKEANDKLMRTGDFTPGDALSDAENKECSVHGYE